MKLRKMLALILTVTLVCSVAAFTPAGPSAVAEDAATVSLAPSEDTYIDANSADTPVNADKTTLEIGYNSKNPLPVETGFVGGENRGDAGRSRDAFLRFDLGDIDPSTVSSAVLKLYVADASTMIENFKKHGVTASALAFYEVGDNWSASALTWNNAPAAKAESLAAVSRPLGSGSAKLGAEITADLTRYIRENKKTRFSLRVKAGAAGVIVHSSESGSFALRPALEITRDPALASSEYGCVALTEDTYAEDSEGNRAKDLSAETEMIIAANKTIGGSTGALYTRNAFVKFSLPKGENLHYDKAALTFRALSIAEANQTVSLTPIDKNWAASSVNWGNKPAVSGTAAAKVIIPNNSSAVLDYFTLDITDYINQHPSDDGVYAFALTADTAVSHIYSSEAGESFAPKVDYIRRKTAAVTVKYEGPSGEELKSPLMERLPIGERYTPDIPEKINGMIYDAAATERKNPLPVAISGDTEITLVYADKLPEGTVPVSPVTTVQYHAPKLPESVDVRFSDGSVQPYPVKWDAVAESSYAEGGEFKVSGKLQGIETDAVEVTVKVLEITGVRMPALSTTLGVYPALPRALTVDVEDNSTVTMGVVWDEVDSSAYGSAGSFSVGGRLVPGNRPVNQLVLIEEGDIEDRPALADTFIVESEPTSPHNAHPMDDKAPEKGTALRITGTKTGTNTDAGTERKAFLRFEGGGFGDEIIHDEYSGEKGEDVNSIVNASLRLYFDHIDNDASPTYSVYGIPAELDTWDEGEITWNNSRNIVDGAELISSRKLPKATKGWVDLDVTGYVRDHRNDEYLSFMVEADTCAAYVTDREGSSDTAPSLRTAKYVKYAPVTLHYVDENGGEIAESVDMLGKLSKPFSYDGAVPESIRGEDGCIYYYDYVYDWLAEHPDEIDPPVIEDGGGAAPAASGVDSGVKGNPEPDENLCLKSLAQDKNDIYARYTKRDIVRAEPALSAAGGAATIRGVRPQLPTSVKAYLDNGAPIIKNVTWRWDEADFCTYAKKGSFTLYGDVDDTELFRAEAKITVGEACYGEGQLPADNAFALENGATYRLVFTKGLAETPSYAADVLVTGLMLKDEDSGLEPAPPLPAYGLMNEMSEAAFLEYLAGFNEGDSVELFFTVPEDEGEGAAPELTLPETLAFFRDARLYAVQGRGATLTLHYMNGGDEIETREMQLEAGSSYSLTEADCSVLDGEFVVTGVYDGAAGDLAKLTDAITMETDGMNAYLSCARVPELTASSAVENLMDENGTAYSRSDALLINGTEEEISADVIIARFSEDGRLLGITDETVTALPDTRISYEKDTALGSGEYTLIFLWNKTNGMNPYVRAVDSRNPEGAFPKPDGAEMIVVPAIERSIISCSNQQEGNEAVNILDRESSTRWSGQTKGAVGSNDEKPVEAVVDLGAVYELHNIGLGFYRGSSRSTGFAVELSEDGTEYTTAIYKRYSSGSSPYTEYFPAGDLAARYVKIVGYGWKAKELTDHGYDDASDNWFSLTAFEAYGSAVGETVAEDESFNAAGSLGEAGWASAALPEMTYTDYTPATGSGLYADIAPTPSGVGFEDGNMALHLYDNVDREDKGAGAGSIGASHKLALPGDKYRVKFKWYVPNTIDGSTYNAQWAGVTLSSGRVTGGDDTSHPAALQLRLAPSGKNKMGFNLMRSITYNEGSQTTLLGGGTAFKANCVWDVVLDVDSSADSVIVTVSDGDKTESAFVRYGLYNDERTMSQTWKNSYVNYIMFNTGAGGKCEMYIDDFSVKIAGLPEDEGTVLKSYDFNDMSGAIEKDNGSGLSAAAIKEDNFPNYTSSLGSGLYVDIASSAITDKALHLYDVVGRTTNSSRGAGGAFAYVDLGGFSEKNLTKLSFDMYAPTHDEWGGIALAHGHNSGGADKTNPLALQMRFSPQNDGMQLNRNTSIQYNKGDNNAFIGTGGNRLKYGALWHFELTYNPTGQSLSVRVTDGSTISTAAASLPTEGDDSWTADWSKTPIDTLIINTGAGGKGDIYVDNVTVRDLGPAKPNVAAVNGIVRLQDAYDTNGGGKGQSYFVVNANTVNSKLGVTSGVNPFYTRFVERRGLIDPEGVSFELIGQPGCYVYVNSNNEVSVQRYKDTDAFRTNATFIKTAKVGKNGDYSYALYREPTRYLRVNGNYVETKTSKDGNWDDGMKLACSFFLRDESKNYVSDSFNGSTLSSQWHKGYPWWSDHHNHSAVHRDKNVVVGSGRVLLKAEKVDGDDWITNSSGQTGYNDSINGGKWKKYCATTGVISVNSKHYNKGSYIEGSFKQPNSPRGYWTAFWLNHDGSWPPETDMFEYLSSHGTNTWYTATHGGGNEGAGWMYHSSVGNMRTQWNTFSIDWGWDYIDMYVNGNLYFSRRGTSDVSYQKDMFLIINTGIGAWESEPDSTTVWNTGLECQWIRSYQYY